MRPKPCTLIAAIIVLAAAPVLAQMSKKERQELVAQIKALDKDAVHKLVTAVEEDPLGENAELIRPALMVYFEDIDYDVCLNQMGPLLESKNEAHRAIFWQIVFSSGDFFIQHPDQSTDIEAYTLAGFEAGLRAYQRILQREPKSRLDFLDELVARQNEGKLLDHINANPCPD